MIDAYYLNIRHVSFGILMGSILWASSVAGKVLAEETPPTVQRLNFEDFELELPKGLSKDDFYLPTNNPIFRDKVELGRTLFFDRRLSSDNTISCASCHIPQMAFTDGRPVSMGVDLREGERNTPTIINRAFSREQFWDGRASSLEEQSKAPLINPKEMGMASHEEVVNKVREIKGYVSWFNRVFGRDVNSDDLAKAIAAFERTVVSGNSRFDKFREGHQDIFNQSEKRGLVLFEGKARCSQCHSGPNFTDEKYHNLGVDWGATFVDVGRYIVTNNEQDIGAFKTPTLREVAHTSPYMHNGAFATLEDTIDFYIKGGIANPFLDVEMRRPNRTLEQMLEFYEKERTQKGSPQESEKRSLPEIELVKLDLTEQDKVDLVAFLRTMSGQGWQHITPPSSFPE